ncbi:MAG TPA: RraA family protein [Casimicrobiaceae bacterium]|nr:RraA family protein [Casimicrobiaceae bacterium]
MNPDFRRDFTRIAAATVRDAARYQAALLADVAGRRGTLNGRIQPLDRSMRCAGPALTIEVRPGDNLMIHAALTFARPGDVLVIDGKADLSCALMGAIMMNQCKARELAGVVIDGAVRDVEELLELGFPVFCAGANPNGPTKYQPGRVNWPISIGGVAVQPGDLVVGDADGVVIVERERAASLIPLVQAKLDDETKRIASIKQGNAATPGWLEPALRAAGVLDEGEPL